MKEFGRVVIPMFPVHQDDVLLLIQTSLHCIKCGEEGLWIKMADMEKQPPLPAEAYCRHCETKFTYIVEGVSGVSSFVAHRIRQQIEWQESEKIKVATEWWDSLGPEKQREYIESQRNEELDIKPLLSFMQPISNNS